MDALKKYWRRWNVRKAFGGDQSAMNRLYLLTDPWQLNNPNEHFRFRETVRVIETRMPPRLGSILEIGCGEGLQTEYLACIADRVHGLDASRHAIRRAKGRGIANAVFEVGDFLNYNQADKAFDLVTACEILYYVPNLDLAYEKLTGLGHHRIVTYYQGAFGLLDEFFLTRNVQSCTISGPSCKWRVVCW